MRRWLAKRADFGANRGRGYQHSHGCRQRVCAGDQDSHQRPDIARANAISDLADTFSQYADTRIGSAGSRFEYANAYTCPRAGPVDFGDCRGYNGPFSGQGAIRAS